MISYLSFLIHFFLDGDVGSNSELTYSLVSGDTSAFSINSTTGAISNAILFDRETKDTYTLNVRATDHGAIQLTGTTTVVVTILDVNDNKPQIKNLPQTIRVSEGSAVGTNVFMLSASDKDKGERRQLSVQMKTFDGLFILNVKENKNLSEKRLEITGTNTPVNTCSAFKDYFPALR